MWAGPGIGLGAGSGSGGRVGGIGTRVGHVLRTRGQRGGVRPFERRSVLAGGSRLLAFAGHGTRLVGTAIAGLDRLGGGHLGCQHRHRRQDRVTGGLAGRRLGGGAAVVGGRGVVLPVGLALAFHRVGIRVAVAFRSLVGGAALVGLVFLGGLIGFAVAAGMDHGLETAVRLRAEGTSGVSGVSGAGGRGLAGAGIGGVGRFAVGGVGGGGRGVAIR